MGLKQALREKRVTLGSWITLGHPSVAEIMAAAGFEWLTVDMEHSAITLHQAQQLVQVIELSGLSPLVRVGENSPNLIKRAMDTGAHGVIVPMVNTREEAERAVESVKYPARGMRGVGLARAQRYGADFEGYRKWNEVESVVIVQVEHIKAVENLRDILATEGVDAFIVGPYDLSGSLGVPGQFEHPKVVEALGEVDRLAKELDAVSGFHVIPPEPGEVLMKMAQGYRLIAFSLDTLFIINSCRSGLKEIKDKMGGAS